MILLGASLVVGALFFGGWYWASVCLARRKAVRILRWIAASLSGQGHVSGIRWLSTSSFKVPLRLTSGVFHRAWIVVELSRCGTPVHWLWSRLNHRQDLITFQADLDWAPPFSLEVHNFRWFARSSRKNAPGTGGDWTFEQGGPFIISTRLDWQKEITSAMSSLVSVGNREFLSISFSRRSPHFSVTMLLDAISPGCPTRGCMFDAVREVAASSLPSLF